VADSPALRAARERVGSAISEFAAVLLAELHGPDGHQPDDELDPAQAGSPMVVAWVAAFEATNMTLEQGQKAYRQGFGSLDQTISAGEGLAHVVARAYS
jgi:hypothetical protein